MASTHRLAFLLLSLIVLSTFISPSRQQNEEFTNIDAFIRPSLAISEKSKKIDFSHVKVELYSLPSGNQSPKHLKDSTSCAENGYYIFQVYTDGTYELQVKGPEHWIFEPNIIQFQVSQGNIHYRDNEEFSFMGMKINGKVFGKSLQAAGVDVKGGPSGVTLELIDSSSKQTVQSVKSEVDGRFTFKSVLPGTYKIRGSHHIWSVAGELDAIVDLDKVEVNDDNKIIEVQGYDIIGRVVSDSLPMSGVHFSLSPCPPSPKLTSKNTVVEETPESICTTISDQEGRFHFKSIPAGSYSLIPFYKGFKVAPGQLSITVHHETLDLLSKQFEVKGFTVQGSLADPIEDVEIVLNGEAITKTDKSGHFELPEIVSGQTYTIEARKKHFVFERLDNLQFLPSKQQLDRAISLVALDVCGKIILSDSSFSAKGRPIHLSHTDGRLVHETKTVDDDGLFCVGVPIGSNTEYEIKPTLNDQERKQGLVFEPSSRIIKTSILKKPLLYTPNEKDAIEFKQVLLSLSGKLTTLSPNKSLPSSIQIKIEYVRTGKTLTTNLSDKDNTFSFNDILPNNLYRISIVQPDTLKWCWNHDGKQEVKVLESSVNNIEFKQIGYSITVHSTSDHVLLQSKDKSISFDISKGTHQICIPLLGKLQLEAQHTNKCLQFNKDTYTIDTEKNEMDIQISATKYLVHGKIIVDSKSLHSSEQSDSGDAIKITVHEDGKKLFIDSTKHKSNQELYYTYEYWATIGKAAQFKPSSTIFIFKPSILEVKQEDLNMKHPKKLETILGIKGHFLTGTVYPSIKGVLITVYKGGEELVSTETNEKGEYRAGPLYSVEQDQGYEIVATKVGYKFSPKDSNGRDFVVTQLCQLSIKVVSQEDGKPISGVFISLIGSTDRKFRTNALTNDKGVAEFTDLLSGKFFVKPLLKEYRFEPSGMISVELNKGRKEQRIGAKRHQYSAYGTVRSLNGQPISNVLIEAHPQPGSNAFTEEAKSDQNGSFRIRGLNPNVKYDIVVKRNVKSTVSPSGNNLSGVTDVEICSPEVYPVSQKGLSDFTDINFLCISSFSDDIEVITGQLQSNIDEIMRRDQSAKGTIIEVELLAGIDPTKAKVIRSIKLPASKYFQFLVPKDEIGNSNLVNFYVRLSSNLNRQIYQYNTPLVSVRDLQTNENRHVMMQFYPEVSYTDTSKQHAQAKPQFYALLVVIISFLIYLNQSKLSTVFDFLSPSPGVPIRSNATPTASSKSTAYIHRKSKK